MKAWTQPGPFAFNGRYNQLRYVNPWPQPLQKPHPPVWLAGGGSVETCEMAVNNDYTYSFLSFFGYQLRQEGDGRVLGDGRPPRRRPQPVPGRLRPADLRRRDRRAGRGAVHASTSCTSSTSACTSRRTSWSRPATAPSAAPSSSSRRTRRRDGRRGRRRANDWKSLVDSGFVIAGSPDDGDRAAASRRAAACASATCIALLQIGSMPHELTKQNITLFAEEVMPQHRARCGPTRAGSTGGGRRAPARATPSARRWRGE